ncbi:hypothetical protein J6590_099778 [Homalodisca vitripennis]|nr:hypothetical protein J6590_099778 [Homalodisca vitripennis]
MSGKWKFRPNKRASLHSDHDTSSHSSSYKPEIVSLSSNGKSQNCDLHSRQISKVRDTSLTSHFKYGERLAETPSIVDDQCCVKEGRLLKGGSKIIANSILYRADIINAALIDLNDQLQLMWWNFGISRRHLARDGRDLSRYGNRCQGSLMFRSLERVHGGNSELPAMNRPLKELSPENSQSVFPPLPPQSVTDSASFLELSPNPPTLT